MAFTSTRATVAVVALIAFASAHKHSLTPKCSDVKAHYRATCCGADESVDSEIYFDNSIYRKGCHSTVAQNMTSGPIVGGTLYAYDPTANQVGSNATWTTLPHGKTYVDIAASSIAAGCVPKHKPHMVRPSPDGKYTAVTYTGDQDFALFKNDEYKVVGCPTVDFQKPRIFGGATHDGAWHGNDTFLLVDMTGCVDGTCGGGIHKFVFQHSASGLVVPTAPTGSLGFAGVAAARQHSSTKPISMGNNPAGPHSDFFFVSDAKGAGSIMNVTSMTWFKHFTMVDFAAGGGVTATGGATACAGGGLWVEASPTEPNVVFVIYGKQGSTSAPGGNCIWKVDMAALTLTKLIHLPDNTDTHGLAFCQTSTGYNMLITNRQTSTLDVIKYDGTILQLGYDINANAFNNATVNWFKETRRAGHLEQGETNKLQPDVVVYHDGFLYMAARGPKPVSAVKAVNFLPNARPGMFALAIDKTTCLPMTDQSTAFGLATLERSPQITSDVHGIYAVPVAGKMQLWAVDQAGTGSVQQYQVYSKCNAIGVTDHAADPGIAKSSRV